MLPGNRLYERYTVHFLMISVLYQSLLHAATIIIVYNYSIKYLINFVCRICTMTSNSVCSSFIGINKVVAREPVVEIKL